MLIASGYTQTRRGMTGSGTVFSFNPYYITGGATIGSAIRDKARQDTEGICRGEIGFEKPSFHLEFLTDYDNVFAMGIVRSPQMKGPGRES